MLEGGAVSIEMEFEKRENSLRRQLTLGTKAKEPFGKYSRQVPTLALHSTPIDRLQKFVKLFTKLHKNEIQNTKMSVEYIRRLQHYRNLTRNLH